MNSKRKGNAFERTIAKMLSLWYYQQDPNVLVRNVNSGSTATIRGDRSMNCGDLIQVKTWDRIFPFSVETKHVARGGLCDFLDGGPMLDAWNQTKAECEDGKQPLLVYSVGRKVYAVTNREGAAQWYEHPAGFFDCGKLEYDGNVIFLLKEALK